MLTLRRDQVTELRAHSRRDPDRQLIEHVRERFPVDLELIGEPALAAAVPIARERAAELGFETRDQVRRYFDLTLVLGSHFHRDPMLPWTAEALDPRRRRDPDARIARLHESALAYLDRTAGPDGKYFRAAMLRVRKLEFDRLDVDSDLREAQSALLRDLYPERAAELDDDSLVEYLDELAGEASLREARSNAERMLDSLLAFMLGIGFAEDPLLPWVTELRSASDEMEPDEAARSLYGGAKAHLERAIALMRKAGS